MSDILRRDRNANILRYVRSVDCADCAGTRLCAEARSVQVHGLSITEVVQMELAALKSWLGTRDWSVVAQTVVDKIVAQVDLLADLGLGHLTLDRTAVSLRASPIVLSTER